MNNAWLYAEDETGRRYPFSVCTQNNILTLTLKKELFSKSKELRVLPALGRAAVGESGYYLLPRSRDHLGEMLISFCQRENCSVRIKEPVLSLYGISRPGLCCLVRIARTCRYQLTASCTDGIYTVFPIFKTAENPVPEDIVLELLLLPEGSTYADMARAERERRLALGEIRPLRDRAAEREVLAYSCRSPIIRIRMGWKPSPSPIPHQTPETEPPMHVACTFADVRRLADELRRQGVEAAELQLVGWNIGGHDGRFPQFLPPDARLGGETELRRTIEYVKSLGYRISTHTNGLDAYEIADCFTWDDIARQPDGTPLQIGHYSGGDAYRICIQRQEKIARRDLPAVAALGENGLHFTDVISIIEPDLCYSPAHPSSMAAGIAAAQRVMAYTRTLFGGFSSEGCYDFAIPYLDYGLYATFGDSFKHTEIPLCDRYLPFFELVYHGILLYNPMSATVNYSIQPTADQLRFILRGGRPTFYFYSKFRTGTAKNWMGENDLTLDTDEALTSSVTAIRRACDEYCMLWNKQFCYLLNYSFPIDGLEVASYSDNSRIAANFTDAPVEYEGHIIEALSYIVIE